MSTRVEVALSPAALADVSALRRIALWGLLAAKMLGGWGVQWDIRWPLLIGRDSFWIAPHLLTWEPRRCSWRWACSAFTGSAWAWPTSASRSPKPRRPSRRRSRPTPDSPIAIAYEMARRNGSVPGRSLALRVLPVLPAALMVLADPRRRWAAASLTLGLALLGGSAWRFAGIPALHHALPSLADAALATLAVTLAALAGGALAARLSRTIPPV
jgi:hypothetical protein